MKIMQQLENNNPILFEKILKYYDEMKYEQISEFDDWWVLG